MTSARTGFQPRNTPAERRAFFDLDRRIRDFVTQADVDAAVAPLATDAELAAAIAPLPTVTGPTAVTVVNGWVAYGGGYQVPQVYRVGKRISLVGLFKNNTGAAATSGQIASLPSWAFPAASVVVWGLIPATQPTCRVDVSPTGTVTINAVPAVSIPAGQYISLNCAWLTP
jgi:hypothetical protein